MLASIRFGKHRKHKRTVAMLQRPELEFDEGSGERKKLESRNLEATPTKSSAGQANSPTDHRPTTQKIHHEQKNMYACLLVYLTCNTQDHTHPRNFLLQADFIPLAKRCYREYKYRTRSLAKTTIFVFACPLPPPPPFYEERRLGK